MLQLSVLIDLFLVGIMHSAVTNLGRRKFTPIRLHWPAFVLISLMTPKANSARNALAKWSPVHSTGKNLIPEWRISFSGLPFVCPFMMQHKSRLHSMSLALQCLL